MRGKTKGQGQFRINLRSLPGHRTSCNQHSRLSLQGALIFADPATDTETINDVRLFHPHRPALLIKYVELPKFDRLIGGGAMLLADNAGDAPGMG